MNNFIQLPTEFADTPKPQSGSPVVRNSSVRSAGDDRAKDALIRVFAFVGLVAILVFGTYAVVTYIPVAVRGLSSTLSGLVSDSDGEPENGHLAVTSDRFTVRTGEAFSLSWAVGNSEFGSFAFSYPCIAGVHFDTVTMGTKEIAHCNVENRFLNEGNTLPLIGYSSAGTITEVPLRITFTPNGETRVAAHDTVQITISSEAMITPTISTTPAPVSAGTNGASTARIPSGSGTRVAGPRTETVRQIPTTPGTVAGGPQYIDLTARILATGFIASSSNGFVQADEIPSNLRGAVKFEITNVGTKATREWRFNVALPTYPSYIFHSDTQQPLLPGDNVEYLIAFDSIERQSEGTITINVDPTSSINEPNKTNNIIKGTVKIRIVN